MTRYTRAATRRRFRFLFDEAEKDLNRDMRRVLAEMAERNLLGSSITIEKTVAAVEAHASQAVAAALESVSRATAKPGRKRQKLVQLLREELNQHWDRIGDLAWSRIGRPEWGRSRVHFDRFREDAWPRVLTPVHQYDAGWIDPIGTPWKERHPHLYDTVILLVGGVVGAIVSSIVLPKIDLGNLIALTPDAAGDSH